MARLVLRSRRVVTPEGEREAAIVIRDGLIEAVLPPGEAPADASVEDLDPLVLMPGLVDSHVHVNEPGRTEWEGFATATDAAAVGGITTIVDMPLNSRPVTTTCAALTVKKDAARRQCHVDVAFWGGVVPGNANHLEPMVEAGVCGFKAFLVQSGIDDFPHCGEADLRAALPVLRGLRVPLLAHAEVDIGADAGSRAGAGSSSYATYLRTRPKAWENAAIERLIDLSAEYRAAVHVVHLSSDEAVPLLAEGRKRGVPITAETCPHYLCFAAEEIEDGRTELKCAPPIREASNREALWAALRAGTIGLVVSDHSPCVPSLKSQEDGDFLKAWGGIASLQFALSAVWTEARRRGHAIEDVVRWMCREPARLAGLDDRKGRLAVGCDADVVAFDPEARFVVSQDMIRHRHPLTPYLGRTLHGRVAATFLRGVKVQEGGKPLGPPLGQLLERRHDGFR